MLSTAKPILENQLLKILYDAYMTQYETNQLSDISKYDYEIKDKFLILATKFSQEAAGPTAEAIYKFIKEIGINITIPPSITAPPVPPTLPGGPCSGAIPISNITIS